MEKSNLEQRATEIAKPPRGMMGLRVTAGSQRPHKASGATTPEAA